MSTDETTGQDAADTLAAVVRLLSRAADMAWDRAARRAPLMTGLGLGAQLAASHALALLPQDAPVDDPVPVETDPVQLLRAAEQLTRVHPVEQFPPGTSQVIVAIIDLLREHAS